MSVGNKFYPGWIVHAGLFICAAVVIGTSSYVFGMFVVPVSDEFGISRANLNNGFIALLMGVACISPFVGRLLDKFSARLVILSGGISYSLGLISLTLTDNLWVLLFIILIPISYGYAACGTLAVNTVIVRWFKRRRGTALGVMAVSTSTGGFFFAPFTALTIENFDWRTALVVNGCVTLAAVALMTLIVVRNFPKGIEHGYHKEFVGAAGSGDGTDQIEGQGHDDKSWTYGELFRNRNFWLLTLGIGLMMSSDQAMITTKVPYFLDIGIDLTAAAFIVSCMTVSAICGKLLVGYLSDKIDLRYVFYGVASAHIALQLVYIAQPSYWVLLFFASVFGVAIGGVFPVWSTLLAGMFGTKSYGTIMGVMTIVVKGMSVVAVRFIGEVHDATGSYVPGFMVFTGGMVLSMVLASFLRPPKREEIRIPDTAVAVK